MVLPRVEEGNLPEEVVVVVVGSCAEGSPVRRSSARGTSVAEIVVAGSLAVQNVVEGNSKVVGEGIPAARSVVV